MPDISPLEHEQILELISRRESGHGLPADFYHDELIYRAELTRIWQRGWLFAGHTCQIPEPGDYFTLEIGSDPLVVVRDDEGTVHALSLIHI